MPEPASKTWRLSLQSRQIFYLARENQQLKKQLKELDKRLKEVECWLDSEDSYRREQLERS